MRAGEGDLGRGMECAAGEVPGHGLRRHPRSVPRSHRALSDRRGGSQYQLPLHGRLCRLVEEETQHVLLPSLFAQFLRPSVIRGL